MSNALSSAPDYQIIESPLGIWRRHLSANGAFYAEFTSRLTLGTWPLLHVVRGRSPETGKIEAARGLVAVGQKAFGVVAIGQAAVGVFAFGQLALGLLVGVGQAAIGLVAIGQGAAGVLVVGQFAVGVEGVAQFGVGPLLHCAWPRH